MDQRRHERFHGALGAALRSFAYHVDSLLNLAKAVPGSGKLFSSSDGRRKMRPSVLLQSWLKSERVHARNECKCVERP